MSHNTVFGGVSREIEGGTPLIGGVAREIESGLVLVGGVAREIGFGPSVCIVTIKGYFNQYSHYVEINGTIYYKETTLEVPAGTNVYCRAFAGPNRPDSITLDGVTAGVVNASGYVYEYTYQINGNVTITSNYDMISSANNYIAITTS